MEPSIAKRKKELEASIAANEAATQGKTEAQEKLEQDKAELLLIRYGEKMEKVKVADSMRSELNDFYAAQIGGKFKVTIEAQAKGGEKTKAVIDLSDRAEGNLSPDEKYARERVIDTIQSAASMFAGTALNAFRNVNASNPVYQELRAARKVS